MSLTSAEDRRAYRKLRWVPSVRRYTILAFVGAAIAMAGLGGVFYLVTHFPMPAQSAADTGLVFGTMGVGMVVFFAGLFLRERAMRKITIRACPACHTDNLWRAAYCSKCGTALAPSSAGAGTPDVRT